MADDDNKGVQMTTTVLNAGTLNGVSEVTFRVTKELTASANMQAVGLNGDYMCLAFFIDRKELEKYNQ